MTSMPAGEPGARPPLATKDVAQLFRVDPKTVTRWHKQGKIRAFRTPAGVRRFPAEQFDELLGLAEEGES